MASGKVMITAENRGPLINMPSWILLVVMCLTTLVKITSKWLMVHRFQYDDIYMFAAMVVTIGFAVAISAQVTAGLGQHQSSLDTEQVARFEQAAYASQILYVTSLCLAKMALLQFLIYLARNNSRRMLVRGVMIFNCTSAMVAILCVAFQCRLPHPWATLHDKCFDQRGFWIAFGFMDIVADIATILSSICLLYDLHVERKQKSPIIAAFAARALMIPIIIVRLVFLSAFSNSIDHPFDDFSTVLTTIVHINFSIMVSCVPFLKPVMDSLQTGVLASDLRTRTPVPSSSRLPISLEKISRKIGSRSMKLMESESQAYSATAMSSGNDDPRDVLSGSSSKEKMVIQKQTTVAVHFDNPTLP
ncbi:hypothetical protein MMC29_004718 [Sticta canariensis]|nr:hypothetical protein [Sticta canariensis]